MLRYFFEGLLLGLAYVAPIGMQNLYVINTAFRMNKLRAYQVAFITIFFDISLALSCFFGIGLLLEKIPILERFVLLFGSIIVIYIGISLIKSKPELSQAVDVDKSIYKIIGICFSVTWLNPQALIDGSLLFGGFRASLPEIYATAFIIGVCIASFTWFTSLTTVISLFKNKINTKIIKIVNIVCGGIVIFYGFKLGYSFLTMFNK